MKQRDAKKGSMTAPVLKELVERDLASQKASCEQASIGSKPLNPPALYEDSGEGYRSGFTFPQD
jgi:hypothetical protein